MTKNVFIKHCALAHICEAFCENVHVLDSYVKVLTLHNLFDFHSFQFAISIENYVQKWKLCRKITCFSSILI